MKFLNTDPGADLGGSLPSGIRPPADPKGPPLYGFEKSIFGDRPWNFLKAHLAPKYTSFEGGARAKKRKKILVKIFRKDPKNAFFGLFFFKNLPAAQNILSKCRLDTDFGELRKSFFFENPPPYPSRKS